MDLRVQLSSCVPATASRPPGARLEVDDLLPLADHPKVLGLAEFMNFPGVLARDPACLAKLAAFQTPPDRRAQPAARAACDLNGYLARRRAHRPRGDQPARGAAKSSPKACRC